MANIQSKVDISLSVQEMITKLKDLKVSPQTSLIRSIKPRSKVRKIINEKNVVPEKREPLKMVDILQCPKK